MTNEEAIESLKCINEKYHVPWHREAIDMAVEALERQIPIGRPKKLWADSRGYTDEYECAKCGAYIRMPYVSDDCDYDYCPFCGSNWTGD